MANLEEIKQMLAGGMTVSAIADEVGVSIGYISRLLSAMGLSGSATRKTVLTRLTDEERADAVEMYLRGEPVAAIIIKYELNYNAFYRLITDQGVEMRERSPENRKIRNERLDLAMKLYQKGITLNQIEIETGIRQPEIHREVVRRGIPMRRAYAHKQTHGMVEDEMFSLSDLTDKERALLLPEADPIYGGFDSDGKVGRMDGVGSSDGSGSEAGAGAGGTDLDSTGLEV
jgi:uncharacterized protein YerC